MLKNYGEVSIDSRGKDFEWRGYDCQVGHGDMYPSAEVVLQVDGVDVKTIAAVSNTMPVLVLQTCWN